MNDKEIREAEQARIIKNLYKYQVFNSNVFTISELIKAMEFEQDEKEA